MMEPHVQPNKNTYWFIFQNNNILLLKHTERLPRQHQCDTLLTYAQKQFQLHQQNNITYSCTEIHKDTPIPEDFDVLSLREALCLLEHDHYALLVKAHAVMQWNKHHQFCGCCGGLTVQQPLQFEKLCPTCEISYFPRISPSIIVRIRKGHQLLMARSPHFPPGVYGLIAGFVDAGESLEEAIHREVMEEVGLKIKNIVYYGSQPWPFPNSLMMAFTADYLSGEITIDTKEIEAAGWYTYDNLPGLPSMAMSIAMQLIHDFSPGHEA